MHSTTEHGENARRSRAACLVLVAAALAVLTPAAPARAAFPGTPGKIAYSSTQGGNTDIFTRTYAVVGQTQVTTTAAVDQQPSYSADGLSIAFAGAAPGNFDVYSVHPNGSGLTRLTTSAGADTDPTWSPDGSKVAFVSDRVGNSDIWVMNSDGSGQVNLTASVAPEDGPAWSPDGTKIAFTRYLSSRWSIMTMNTNGTGVVTVASGSGAQDFREPAWSPSGAKLAFTEQAAGDRDIEVANADGTGQVNVTNTAAYNEDGAAWSPNGLKIAFHSDRAGNGDVWTMNPDGTSLQNQTTANAGDDGYPDWGPAHAPPAVPSAPALDQVSDSGQSDSDGITYDSAPAVTGTGENGSVVAVRVDGAPAGNAIVAGGSWSLSGVAMTEGDHVLTAVASDVAGDQSAASAPAAVTIDTTVDAPLIDSDLPDPSDDLPVFSFTGEPAATFECSLSAGSSVLSGAAPCDSPAIYDLVGQPAATLDFQVRQTDVAGNVSPLAAQSYRFDADSEPPDDPGTPSPGTRGPVPRLAGTLVFSGRSIDVGLQCPATASADCAGRIVLSVAAAKTRARGAAIARRGRRLTIGAARFTVRRGTRRGIAVHISRRGRNLFKNKSSVPVQVGLETRDPDGHKRVTRKVVRVKRGKSRSARR
jgi:dipeptidyl aminopeptidase/acylaminoacyl peptidase